MSSSSSKYFVASAVVIADAAETSARAELSSLRSALGRAAGQVIHFQNLSHSHRLKAAHDLATSSVATVTSVVICKTSLRQAALISQADPMYLWALRLLLERVSWFCDENGQGEAVVTFAHVRHFKTQKLQDYRNALEQTQGVEIRWRVFANHSWRMNAPQQVELLQLADTAASAVFKAVEPDPFGFTEPRYLGELRPVIYRRGSSPVTSYGLKVFPNNMAAPGAPLAFMAQY